MDRLTFLLALLLCCAPIPPRVQARRAQESKLRTCLSVWRNNEVYRRQCVAESAAGCADAGLDPDCATGDIATDLPKDRP